MAEVEAWWSIPNPRAERPEDRSERFVGGTCLIYG